MSRLPFVRQLFKFGRKISKMALKIKSTNYNTLSNQKNSNYFPAFFDTEIDNNLAGSYSSSGYISPKLSEASSNNEDFSKFEIKRGKETDLSSIFDSFNLYETSTVLPKDWQIPKNSIDWEQSINALFDPSLKQFTAFENFVQSSSNGFSDCSLFSYSPLSSLESISNDQHCKFQVPNQVDVQEEEHAQNNDNDLYSNDFSYRMQQECIRREFEMNGKNVDEPEVDENFHPLAMSTPFVERKSDQYKLNYSKNNETTKVQTQFSPPKHHQLSAMSVPFHPSNSNKENFNKMQFDSIYPPPYLIPSIPHDYKAEKKIHGRKRGHHQLIQSHVTLQNQLPMINTNNPNRQQFGAGNEKKLDNKKSSSKKKKLDDHCVFCKNNGADEILYKSHTVKDLKGRVLCPKLRAYQCPICGADGDQSHTVKYCPKKPIVTMDDLKKMEASKKTNGHASHRF